MTAAAPALVDYGAIAARDVTVIVTSGPTIPLGEEDTGGRSRWWIRLDETAGGSVRGADGRKGRAKRAPLPNRGFVVFPCPADPRRTALGPCTFTAALAPGGDYVLGVGSGNRIAFRVPCVLAPGSVVTIEPDPCNPEHAAIAWSVPSAEAPF